MLAPSSLSNARHSCRGGKRSQRVACLQHACPLQTSCCGLAVRARCEGRLLAGWEQEEVAAATAAVSQLGGAPAVVRAVESHGPRGQRTAVLVAKVAATPAKFPRRPKQIAKRPL